RQIIEVREHRDLLRGPSDQGKFESQNAECGQTDLERHRTGRRTIHLRDFNGARPAGSRIVCFSLPASVTADTLGGRSLATVRCVTRDRQETGYRRFIQRRFNREKNVDSSCSFIGAYLLAGRVPRRELADWAAIRKPCSDGSGCSGR